MLFNGEVRRLVGATGVCLILPALVLAQEVAAPVPSPTLIPASATSPAATAEPAAEPAVVPAAPEAAAAEAPPPAGPVGAALRALGVRMPEVEAFYAARGEAPFWTAEPAWSEALLAALAAAPLHGLPAAAHDPARLRALDGDPASVEAAWMKAYLDFAHDIDAGVLDPRKVDREIHIDSHPPAPARLMARLAAATPGNLTDLAPDAPEYAVLVAELARLEAAAAATTAAPPVPPGPTLRPGQRAERVIALRSKLAALGDLAPVPAGEGPADPAFFDATLEAAVRAFQDRSGLTPDGVVGPATVATLNNDADSERHGQILVNLERIRWMHRDMGERHIFVNQASQTMELWDHGEVVLESRVVVGKPTRETRTPEFIDMMDHLVVNPTWHVPVSIATKEILPRLQRDPTYLERNGYRLVPVGPDPVPDGVSSDYSQYSTGYFPFRIKQTPSEANALGRVKFMFPNQFSVYLHDTPQKRFFERDVRLYSHGCVRVQRAFDLAHALLEGQVDDPQAAFGKMLSTGRERRVDLERPVRVYLTYRTAWADRTGLIQFRPDVYGRDAKVLAALEKAGVAVLR